MLTIKVIPINLMRSNKCGGDLLPCREHSGAFVSGSGDDYIPVLITHTAELKPDTLYGNCQPKCPSSARSREHKAEGDAGIAVDFIGSYGTGLLHSGLLQP